MNTAIAKSNLTDSLRAYNELDTWFNRFFRRKKIEEIAHFLLHDIRIGVHSHECSPDEDLKLLIHDALHSGVIKYDHR